MDKETLFNVFMNTLRGSIEPHTLNNRDEYYYYFLKYICTPYNSRSRYYHKIEHIQYMIDVLMKECPAFTTPEMFLAILFHDVVYDDNNKSDDTNERASADMFAQFAKYVKMDVDIRDKAIELILSTEYSTTLKDPYKYQDKCTKEAIGIIRDVDFSAFGDDLDKVLDNGKDVVLECLEFGSEANAVLEGRIGFLGMILNEGLFVTDKFKASREQKALDNIRQELELLKSQGLSLYGIEATI